MIEKATPEWLAEQQAGVGISDEELARSLGYESPGVVDMFKKGCMRVPLGKALALAEALGVDEGVVMRRLLRDADPEALVVMERCLGPLDLSPGERKLIAAIRKANPAREPVPIMFDRSAIITLVVA